MFSWHPLLSATVEEAYEKARDDDYRNKHPHTVARLSPVKPIVVHEFKR